MVALQPQLPMPPPKLCWLLFIARLPLLAVRLFEPSFLHSPSGLSTPSCLSAAATTILHPHTLTPLASHLSPQTGSPNWIHRPAPLLRSDRRSTNHPCSLPAALRALWCGPFFSHRPSAWSGLSPNCLVLGHNNPVRPATSPALDLCVLN